MANTVHLWAVYSTYMCKENFFLSHNTVMCIHSRVGNSLFCSLKRVTWVNHSCCSLLEEWLEQNEWISLLTFFNTIGIHSVWKSKLLFLRANWSFFLLNHTSWGEQNVCALLNSLLFSLFLKKKKEICSFKKRKSVIHSSLSKNKWIAQKKPDSLCHLH